MIGLEELTAAYDRQAERAVPFNVDERAVYVIADTEADLLTEQLGTVLPTLTALQEHDVRSVVHAAFRHGVATGVYATEAAS